MTGKTRTLRSSALAAIAAAFLFSFISAASAANWVPLRDARYDNLCVDMDSVRTEATGWTMYGMTYCSGMHGGEPARILNYAVACGEFLLTGNVVVQLFTTRWEPTEARRIEQLAAQLVCHR